MSGHYYIFHPKLLSSREMIGVVFFLNFRVEPDPSKAVDLSVTFNSKAPCVVGELLPGWISWNV